MKKSHSPASMSDIVLCSHPTVLPGGWAHTVIFLSRSLIPLITVHCKKYYLHMDEQTKKHRTWLLLRCSQALPFPFFFHLKMSKWSNMLHKSFIANWKNVILTSWATPLHNSSVPQLLQRWILICPTSLQAAGRRQICKQKRWRGIGLIE